MFDLPRLKTVSERNRKAVELRPQLARGTQTAIVRIHSDLTCDVESRGHTINCNLGETHGGPGGTPSPGDFAVAALGSCFIQSCLIKFAQHEVPVIGLEVSIEADYDGNVCSEYTDVRCVVQVESDAPESEVQRVIEDAEAMSFTMALFRRPVKTRCEIQVSAPAP